MVLQITLNLFILSLTSLTCSYPQHDLYHNRNPLYIKLLFPYIDQGITCVCVYLNTLTLQHVCTCHYKYYIFTDFMTWKGQITGCYVCVYLNTYDMYVHVITNMTGYCIFTILYVTQYLTCLYMSSLHNMNRVLCVQSCNLTYKMYIHVNL